MGYPNYTNIFSGSSSQVPLAGGLSSFMEDYNKFMEGGGKNLTDKNFLPFAIFMQQRNAERMNDPANITKQFEALEAPLGRMAQQAAGIQAQKDMRSLVGNIASSFLDAAKQGWGAKFAYDQPVFSNLMGSLAPNPYAYGVLNRRGIG